MSFSILRELNSNSNFPQVKHMILVLRWCVLVLHFSLQEQFLWLTIDMTTWDFYFDYFLGAHNWIKLLSEIPIEQVVQDAGHSANEPGIAAGLVAANEKLKNIIKKGSWKKMCIKLPLRSTFLGTWIAINREGKQIRCWKELRNSVIHVLSAAVFFNGRMDFPSMSNLSFVFWIYGFTFGSVCEFEF